MSFPSMEELDDLLKLGFLGNREPEFQEAKRRVRKVLLENRPSSAWITQEGVAKRAGLSERAAAAALDALRVEGVAKRGKSRERGVVWRWK